MKKHRILRTMLILIFLNGSSSLMRAQTANTGALSGRITDPSGAVVPTVEVKLTNQSTGEQRTVTTGPEGLYKAPLLPPGNYQVTITATGFKTATYPAVVVRVTETNEFNVVLEVGTATEQVTVEAAASLVTTEKAALGRVVDNASICVPSPGNAELPTHHDSFARCAGKCSRRHRTRKKSYRRVRSWRQGH